MILEAIDSARSGKQEADARKAGIEAAINTLEESLAQQEKKTLECREHLTLTLQSNRMGSKEEFRQLLASEQEIEDTEKKILDYEQALRTNREMLEQAEKDAAGKTKTDEEILQKEVRKQNDLVEELRRRSAEIGHRLQNTNGCGKIYRSRRTSWKSAAEKANVTAGCAIWCPAISATGQRSHLNNIYRRQALTILSPRPTGAFCP